MMTEEAPKRRYAVDSLLRRRQIRERLAREAEKKLAAATAKAIAAKEKELARKAATKVKRMTRAEARKTVGTVAWINAQAKRKAKYNAHGEWVNGKWMASGAQAERYRQLLELEGDNVIENLKTEVPFDLVVNNVKICRYRADFTYDVIDDRGNVLRSNVEDVKGMATQEFKLKRKLFDALMPIPLTVIESKGQAIHPVSNVRSAAGWMHKMWKGRLPD